MATEHHPAHSGTSRCRSAPHALRHGRTRIPSPWPLAFPLVIGFLTATPLVAQPAASAGDPRKTPVVWRAPIGFFSNGSPVVHRGKVLIGSNHWIGDGKRGDGRGVMLCFDQTTGRCSAR